MNTRDWMAVLLIFLLIGGGLAAPLRNRGRGEETANLELISDPHLIKDHISLFDDYGLRPMPPHLPPYLRSPYQPDLEDEYY
ncbi:hypothetical protein J4Q44_G00324180 [Coregonus suidteri]|uniref:Uncharacterized protein n=1 Tax=Coregonus suidteri TaxID=861788 RepID=A0AAN8L4S8_9TELE